jgi:hypothetical protein
MEEMRSAGLLLLLLLGSCRVNFDTLDADGLVGDGDGSVATDGGPGAELGAFGAPMQQIALSSARSDQGPSLTADLLEIYFFSNRNCPSCYDIFVAKRATTADAWGPATELAELTNAAPDMTPEISADGLTLWYASERETPPGGADIWVTTRASRTAGWAPPMRETSLSTAGYDHDPALSEDGLTMTLTSDGNGDIGGDMLVATRTDAGAPWSMPAPITSLNTTALEAAASMRDSGRVLFFGRETSAFDIYVATRESPAAAFGTPVMLANINSAQLDFDAWVSADMRTIFFASSRTGDMEIYEAKR